MSETEVLAFRNENTGLCNIEKERISSVLLIQLTCAQKHRLIDTFSVTDVIQNLEKNVVSSTKKGEQFKRPPLKGLWKAHYMDARFISNNLFNATMRGKKFTKIFNSVEESAKREGSGFDWAGDLGHKLTVGAYEAKEQFTGEWLIYAKHKAKNYYLCISKHTTGKGDQVLYEFIRHFCAPEFPFLTQAGA